MIAIIERIKKMDKSEITISRVLKAIIRRILNIPHKLAWILPFRFTIENKEKLKKFYNIHKGKRCFVIANGPSLNKIDFKMLESEYTIGMNRIYLMEKVNGFKPNYLVCIDKKSQLLQFTDEYNNQDGICFYEWDLRNKFDKKDNFYFIKSKFSPKFSGNVLKEPFGSGMSVSYTCLQLAYYMGFSEVYIIGKDHSFNTNQKAGIAVKNDNDDDNHFIKDYYKKGQRWDVPDYKSEEFAYSLARRAFEENGRIIKDATIGGKLNVFEKVDFNKLF